MKYRAALTGIWLVSFACSVVLLKAYAYLHDSNGKLLLLPEEVSTSLKPLIALYGGYLTAILGFWYVRPFKKPRANEAETVCFVLAVICTLLLNLTVIYVISEPYWNENIAVSDAAHNSVTLARWLSFLVAPANLYYFGVKPS
jgi:hypothetical protein